MICVLGLTVTRSSFFNSIRKIAELESELVTIGNDLRAKETCELTVRTLYGDTCVVMSHI